jgi:hypothetical protein
MQPDAVVEGAPAPKLLDNYQPRLWRLDPVTRELGRAGVAACRKILAETTAA